MLTDRIAAVVDVALELLGLLTRGRDGPVGGGADSIAALLTVAASPIVEDEGDRASGGDAGAEAFCIGVVGDAIAGRRAPLRPHPLFWLPLCPGQWGGPVRALAPPRGGGGRGACR